MNFAFPWPYTQGEWLAWAAAAFTVLTGLVVMVAPRLGLRVLRLSVARDHPQGLAAVRAQLGGFYVGLGVAAMLFAQPLIYMALGLAWALAALGHLLSMLADRGNTPFNWACFAVALVLAALPAAFVFGLLV